MIAENSRKFIFFDNNYFIKHDLSHVFTSAVNGTDIDEFPADRMDFSLFPFNQGIRSWAEGDDISERANVIAALYQTVFGIPIEKVDFQKLKAIPLTVFGIRPVASELRTNYEMLGTEARAGFIEEFERLCEIEGIEIAVHSDALREIPETLPPSHTFKPQKDDYAAALSILEEYKIPKSQKLDLIPIKQDFLFKEYNKSYLYNLKISDLSLLKTDQFMWSGNKQSMLISPDKLGF